VDLQPHLEGAVKVKDDAAGGDIFGDGGKFSFSAGENDRQRQWKANGTTYFLTGGGRIRLHVQGR